MYRINKHDSHLSILLRQSNRIFHTQDLAVLWEISNHNTLYTAIKRYVARRILFRLFKGFYALCPISELDPFELGAKALHGFCYLSLETVLQEHGLINAFVSQITFAGSVSKNFSIGENHYKIRKLKDVFLYNAAGVREERGIHVATLARAVADTLYFNPYFYFDAPISWKEVAAMQKSVGYPLTPKRYVNP